MLARKCDCCGKFYDMYNTDRGSNGKFLPNAIQLLSVNEEDVALFEDKVIDCCPSCMSVILTLIDEKNRNWEERL